MSDCIAAELFPYRAAGLFQLVLLQHSEYDDERTIIEEAADDAAYESFHPEQRDADDSVCGPHHEQDGGSKQMTFVQVYEMLHSQNSSVACAVLLLRPLANAADAHCTVLSPLITTAEILVTEAPVTVPEASAFRPLLLSHSAHC